MRLLFICFFAVVTRSVVSAQNFTVTLQAPQYNSGIAYLTYHMGPNLNVEDSAAVNSKGVAIFTGKRKLPPGIYAIKRFNTVSVKRKNNKFFKRHFKNCLTR